MDKEFIVTGHLREAKSKESQTYIYHRSFFTQSKEQAVKNFHNHFKPNLEVIKIFSVVDEYGNIL